ncbi:lysozyme inhibitor LprI family protein [Acinetobacter soli]|uniref:lysozyme inhibitor LprI family protein n=1 Tax=Acinetobacter soli TaxID=487316 RepID=UPI00125FA46F|nr:lysozyme inhibitor LprI family protein [Acinetobacter soli]
MKKLILLTALLSTGAWADCNNPQNAFEGQKCLSNEVTSLKKELNKTYMKAYATTEAKKELDSSQKKWLAYKESQCGDFVVADTQGSPATVSTDLYCQTILIKQRISFLKEFVLD